jgi:glycosyltransferase involved in cell wall biosynthesis
MRLLFLAAAPPSRTHGGGALRMFHLVRFLGERFDLDLVAPDAEGAEDSTRLLRSRCREMELVPPAPGAARRRLLRLGPYEKDPALARAIHRRLASGRYAAVQVEKPAMLPYLPKAVRIPIVLDTFAYGLTGAVRALEHERGVTARVRNLLRLIRFAAFDAFCWPDTHCILVVSELDRQRCLQRRPNARALIVPNGVDCAAIRPGPFREGVPPILLFTGDMGFEPNVQAALTLAHDVLPRVWQTYPDAELRLVGRNPDPRVLNLRGPGVVVTGEVPDMLPHLHTATLYVAPLATGAGTRTKLLEALAAGLPIITSHIGIEGIEAIDGRDLVIADGSRAMSGAVSRLLGAPQERQRLGLAARRLAESRYDWPQCLAPLESLYGRLLSTKRP